MADMKKYLDTVALGTLVDQIKAEDLKTLNAAKAYCDGKDSQFEVAGAAATAESNAKKYADEKVQALADGQVKLNKEAIEKLNGADTVEGSVAKAVKDAKDALQGNIDGVDAKADANAEAIAAINNAETGILKQAKDYTDTEVGKVQDAVDALDEYIGDIPVVEGEETPATIVAYVQKKTAGIATSDNLAELEGRVSKAETDIDNIEKDYLKAADKTELEGKIGTAQAAAEAAQGEVDALEELHAKDKEALEGAIALKADQTALEAVSAVANAAVKQSDYDVKVKALEDEDARIVGLVEAEAGRAAGVEAGLEERLVEVETFFKTAEDETLDTALDTLVEIQKYLDGEGEVADQMLLDIAANKDAIEEHLKVNHDFASADATLKSELEGQIALKAAQADHEALAGRVTTAEGKITTLEGEMDSAEGRLDAVEGAVATKVEQEAYNAKMELLDGEDTAIKGRLDAIELQLGDGEGSVADMIDDAKQEVLDAASEDATTKANAAEQNAKDYADGLDEAMDGRVSALEEVDHTHTNKDELDLIASGDKAKWDEAAGKAHVHANEAELAKIVDGDVAKWNAAEQNAKDYADGLDEAMTTKVDGVDARVKTLEETIVDKAEQDDLEAAVLRIEANEKAIAANASAIGSFTAITSDEVVALFA